MRIPEKARLGRVNELLRGFRRVYRGGKREGSYASDIFDGEGHVRSFHRGGVLGLGSRGGGVCRGCSSVGNVRRRGLGAVIAYGQAPKKLSR